MSREELAIGVERRGLFDGISEVGIAVGTGGDANRSPTPGWRRRGPRLREMPYSAEDWRRHALFMAKLSNCAVNDGAGKRRGRLRLDAALEAAEDSHVAGLQVRRVLWRGESTARREGKRPSWRPGWPRWRGRWPCPRGGSTAVPPSLG